MSSLERSEADPYEGSPERSVEIRQVIAAKYEGPLPHPAVLERYEELLPGAAERVFISWEKESEHRRQAEDYVLRQAYSVETRGQILGFILALCFLAASVWLIGQGHAASGIALIFAEIATLAGAFLYGRRQSSKSEDTSATAADEGEASEEMQ